MTPPPAPGRFRWYLGTLLFIATTLYYYDRQIFTFAVNSTNPEYAALIRFLGPDGKVDNVLFGYIDTAHKIAYAVGFLLMGRFIDRIGLRRGFAIGMTLWSLATAALVFCHSFWSLFAGMLVLGFFQATDHPACVKLVAEWFPATERSVAVAYYNSGTNFGAMIVSLAVPAITLALGWRMGYLVPAAVGLAWVVAWLLAYGPPETHPRIGAAERAHIVGQRTVSAAVHVPFARLFTVKPVWGFALAKFLIDPVWFIYLTWLPKIFKETYGVDFKKLFIPVMFIYTVSLVGNFVGGGISTAILRRGHSLNRARKLAMLGFALLAVPSFVSAFLSNVWIVVGIIGVVTFAHQAFSTLLLTTVADVFRRDVTASVTGFGGMLGAAGGVLAAVAAGYVSATFGYTPLFFFGSFAYLAALGILHLLNPRLEPAAL